jgi:hypothetical protein
MKYRFEECKIDEHGQAVHEECYLVALALGGTPKPDGKKPVQIHRELMPTHEPIFRCAYCRPGNEFRPMIIRAEGWLQCELGFPRARFASGGARGLGMAPDHKLPRRLCRGS